MRPSGRRVTPESIATCRQGDEAQGDEVAALPDERTSILDLEAYPLTVTRRSTSANAIACRCRRSRTSSATQTGWRSTSTAPSGIEPVPRPQVRHLEQRTQPL